MLVTCAYLSDPSSPWSLQSLFLACIGECHERRVTAIEAFAVVHAAEAEFAERFLHHRTIFPRDFLADYGFATLRSAGRVELMRLELGGLQPVTEDGRVCTPCAARRRSSRARLPGLAEPVSGAWLEAACRSGSPPLPRVMSRLNGTTTAPRSWLPVPLGSPGGAPARTHRRSSFPAPVSQPPV